MFGSGSWSHFSKIWNAHTTLSFSVGQDFTDARVGTTTHSQRPSVTLRKLIECAAVKTHCFSEFSKHTLQMSKQLLMHVT